MGYSINLITRLAQSSRRSVAFLETDEQALNAAAVFNSMNESSDKRSKQQRTLIDRFEHWVQGFIRDKWFHRWPNHRKYAACITFKWNYRNVDQRFYGFVCNPLPKSNPGFQLCVLHSHAQKSQFNTETTYLDLAITLSGLPGVLKAIQISFPDRDSRKEP